MHSNKENIIATETHTEEFKATDFGDAVRLQSLSSRVLLSPDLYIIVEKFNCFVAENPTLSSIRDKINTHCVYETFLIGSTLTRNIIRLFDGEEPRLEKDIDLLIANSDALKIHSLLQKEGWTTSVNGFGSISMSQKAGQEIIRIDLMPFEHVGKQFGSPHEEFKDYSVTSYTELLKRFYKYSPFDIQAIVYAFSSKEILGEMGGKALLDRVVRVNHIQSLLSLQKLCLRSPQAQLKNKAEAYGFTFAKIR